MPRSIRAQLDTRYTHCRNRRRKLGIEFVEDLVLALVKSFFVSLQGCAFQAFDVSPHWMGSAPKVVGPIPLPKYTFECFLPSARFHQVLRHVVKHLQLRRDPVPSSHAEVSGELGNQRLPMLDHPLDFNQLISACSGLVVKLIGVSAS